MRQVFLILGISLALFAQKAPKQTEVKVQKTSLTRDQELQIGKEAAGQVEREMEVVQTPEIEAWLGGRVRAFRTAGDPLMPLPGRGQQRVTCTGFGPGRCDDHLSRTIESFLVGEPGWLCYNVHGLDDEGWGPLGSITLDRVLEHLLAHDVRVLPTGSQEGE